MTSSAAVNSTTASVGVQRSTSTRLIQCCHPKTIVYKSTRTRMVVSVYMAGTNTLGGNSLNTQQSVNSTSYWNKKLEWRAVGNA